MPGPTVPDLVHCRRCGTLTAPLDDGPHGWCPECQRPEYHNPAPAVGVAILRQGKVLLSRRGAPPRQDAWDLVGGFVEPGESALEALRREVREETGLTLEEHTLHDVVSGDYDTAPTLNLLYTATADGEPEAADDSAELRWWPLDALPDDLAWPHEARFLRQLASAPPAG